MIIFERVGGSVTILLLYTYDHYEDLNVKCFNWYENFGALTLCRYTLKAIAHAHNARHAYYIVQNFCKFGHICEIFSLQFYTWHILHGWTVLQSDSTTIGETVSTRRKSS